jgi:hypothetical protein
MKLKFIITALLLYSLPAMNVVVAQDSSAIKTLPPVTVTATTKKIPPMVWFNLSRYFPEAENPRWYGLNKDYLVKFMIYDQENRALFSKKGKLIYHISYGYENNMPEYLRRQIKTGYLDFDIYRAIKIVEGNREVWVINLQDKNELVMLRAENDEIEEVQRLKKSL